MCWESSSVHTREISFLSVLDSDQNKQNLPLPLWWGEGLRDQAEQCGDACSDMSTNRQATELIDKQTLSNFSPGQQTSPYLRDGLQVDRRHKKRKSETLISSLSKDTSAGEGAGALPLCPLPSRILTTQQG